jgi:hypothetical protein
VSAADNDPWRRAKRRSWREVNPTIVALLVLIAVTLAVGISSREESQPAAPASGQPGTAASAQNLTKRPIVGALVKRVPPRSRVRAGKKSAGAATAAQSKSAGK